MPVTLRRLAALSLLAFAPLSAHAQAIDKDMAAKIIAAEKVHSEVLDNLEYLSDRIGPRLTGSARLDAASHWTLARMKVYGLDNVHLEAWTIPEGWERGTLTLTLKEPNGLPVEAAQLAWSPGTKGTVSGPVVAFNPRTEEDLNAFHGKLKNAFVLQGVAAPNPRLLLPDAPDIKPIPALTVTLPPVAPADTSRRSPPAGASLRGFRERVAKFLKDEGAAGALRDSNKPHALLNMTGSWSSVPAVPTLFVAHEYVAMIQRLMAQNVPVTLEMKSTAKFVKGPITVYNTVGEIRGSEKPDEIVLIGGHLDSWDLGTGSTDNGTGSMAVLEAARLIKSLPTPPKRTIRFVLFSGEEEGLFGSHAYVDAHKAEMPSFDVVFIHDTGTGRVKGLWLQNRAEDKPWIDAEFADLQTLDLVTDTPTVLPGKMQGTDHVPFDDAGVPAFSFNQDSAEYGLTHHSQSDTFDKVRPDDLKQGACVLAIMARNAADLPEKFPRTPTVPSRTARN